MTSQAKSVSPLLQTIEADLPAGTVLHLWLKAQDTAGEARLFVTVDRNPAAEPVTRRTGGGRSGWQIFRYGKAGGRIAPRRRSAARIMVAFVSQWINISC